MTVSYTINKMGSGIVSSDRAAAYGKTIYDAIGK
jgi:hypothetical protein